MALSRRYYTMIAGVIREESKNNGTREAQVALAHVAADLAMHLKQDNQLFDVERFLDACGVSED